MRHLFSCRDFVSLTKIIPQKIINGYNFFLNFLLKIIPHGGPEKIYNNPDVNWLKKKIMAVKKSKLWEKNLHNSINDKKKA